MTSTLSATIFITAFMFSGLGVSQSLLAQNDAATQKGNEIYQYWCATCHGAGPGHPGTTALAAKYKGARPGLLEERTDLSPQGIRFAVRRGISIMPFFRKTELTDTDLEAVIGYLTRNRAAAQGPEGRR
jgi:mono/diheme cytochrome c family protein